MNTNAMVVSALKKQRDLLIAKLTGIDAALTAFGGSSSTRTRTSKGVDKGLGLKPDGTPRLRRRRKASVDPVSGLTPIQKAQAALKAKREAAKANANVPKVEGAVLSEAAVAG